MKCAICNHETNYYFSKEFHEEHIRGIIPFADYYRCGHCGFVMSKTLVDMQFEQWQKLNHVFHTTLEKTSRVTLLDQPPYIHQIQMLHILSERDVISLDNALDFAAGYGNMARLLERYYAKQILLFDPYMQDNDGEVIYVSEKELTSYNTVYTSAFFEHSTQRTFLDQANCLVKPDGAMLIYTLISENVPQDPNWFYLDPVHSFFHTRKSMKILMNQWGYEASLFCIPAQTWCLFKKNQYADVIRDINIEFQQLYLLYDTGFVMPVL